MSANYNGEPTPAGTVGTPAEPTPGAGHTNNAQGLGERKSNTSLQRHFDGPDLSSSKISSEFWISFINSTKEKYSQAPDLLQVKLRHSMHPNTTIPAEGDDLDSISPGDSESTSVALTPNINWPQQGPTATRIGPSPDQNPSKASVDTTRINFIFMENRKSRWDD